MISYDTKELINRFGEQAILNDIIKGLEVDLYQDGEVICQVVLNGEPLTEDREQKLAYFPILKITGLKIITSPKQQLVDDVVSGWLKSLPKMIDSCDQYSAEVRNLGISPKLKEISDFLEASQLLVTSLMSIQKMANGNTYIQSDAWVAAEVSLVHSVGQWLNAFEIRDANLLADVLEYDVAHSMGLWLDILKNFPSNR